MKSNGKFRSSAKQKQHRIQTQKGNYSSTQKNNTDHPMKWYKFLIYFALIAGAVLNMLSAIVYFLTFLNELDHFKQNPLVLVNLLYACMLLGMAIYGIYTRQALAHFKKNAPKAVCKLYLWIGISSFVFSIALSLLTETALSVTPFVSLITGLVMAYINHIYFDKRRFLFRY